MEPRRALVRAKDGRILHPHTGITQTALSLRVNDECHTHY